VQVRCLVATAKETGSHGNEFTCNKRGTVTDCVFYAVRVKRLYNEDTNEVKYLYRSPARRRKRRK
jgi:hypothetical protein